MIKGMLDQGIVEPAEGAWSSPIVLAKKTEGSYRFCVDFCRVNDITKKDVHPIPRNWTVWRGRIYSPFLT